MPFLSPPQTPPPFPNYPSTKCTKTQISSPKVANAPYATLQSLSPKCLKFAQNQLFLPPADVLNIHRQSPFSLPVFWFPVRISLTSPHQRKNLSLCRDFFFGTDCNLSIFSFLTLLPLFLSE